MVRLDASVNRIVGASNQSVNISGAGIEVGSDKYQLRIVDNMIAMTDDKWRRQNLLSAICNAGDW